MKILVIQQKRIGDVLLSTILCNNLRLKYPDAIIDFMCHSHCREVLDGNPNINSTIILTDQTRKSYSSFFKFIFEIRANQYDLLIDVYAKLETNLISLFSGSDFKISYHKWYSKLFYNYNVHRLNNNHGTKYGQAIDNRLLLLEPLGFDFNQLNPFPKLYINKEEDEAILLLFEKFQINKNKKIVMISLLGSEVTKTYPLEFMAKTVDFIAKENVTIFFNYFPTQIEDAKKILGFCTESTQKKVIFDLLAPNLKSFIALMNHCDVIIGNDGGAINMAKALDKPSFTIFSAHVNKSDWATFEDGFKNISVHLNDYKPELLKNTSSKNIKENAAELYRKFNPELFQDRLAYFIKSHLH